MEWNEIDTCDYDPVSVDRKMPWWVPILVGNVLFHGAWITAVSTGNMYFLWGMALAFVVAWTLVGIFGFDPDITYEIASHQAKENRLLATGRYERVYREDMPFITYVRKIGSEE